MKCELVRNLKGTEILSSDVFDDRGKLLLSKGTRLTNVYLNLLRQNFVYLVNIENPDEIANKFICNKIEDLKEAMLKSMPEIFNELLEGNRASISILEDYVDSIINIKQLNVGLYELSKYDNYTYIHSIDTGIMSILIGSSLGMNRTELKRLGIGSILHDIGKIKISNQIINKTGKLSFEEFNEIKKHPTYGYNILTDAGVNDQDILSCVIYHHERINGTGYPLGLIKDNISMYPKITAICDVYTALSANRSYRLRFNPNEAYEYIISGKGTLFDNEIVERFRQTFAIYPIGCKVKLSNGVEGEIIKQNKGFPDRPIVMVKQDKEYKDPYKSEIDLLKFIDLVIDYIIQ